MHNYVANHDGNVSALVSKDRIVATPTAESKGDVKEEWLITVDRTGKLLSGRRKPFSELKIHLAAYNSRPDIKAVVHAHPPYSMALSCSGKTLSLLPFPEAIVSLGSEIKVTKFAIPGSQESAAAIVDFILESDVILLANNGVLAVGDTLLQAYYRLELVEHLARTTQITKDLKSVPVTAAEALLKKRRELGFNSVNKDVGLAERITSEVLKRLQV